MARSPSLPLPAPISAASQRLDGSSPPKKRIGRPPAWNEATAVRYLEAIASGCSRAALAADPDMPSLTATTRWNADDRLTVPTLFGQQGTQDQDGGPDGGAGRQTFRAAYLRAKEIRADALVDAIEEDIENTDELNAAAMRVRIDGRRWLAGKYNRAAYGERVTQELVGQGQVGRVDIVIVSARARGDAVLSGPAGAGKQIEGAPAQLLGEPGEGPDGAEVSREAGTARGPGKSS